MARWQALPANRNKRSANNFSKSLDTETNPFYVDDNSLIDGNGWDFNEYPALATRKGKTTTAGGTSGRARFMANFGDTEVLIYTETDGLRRFTDIITTNITGPIVGGDAQEWDSTNFDISGSALIMVNGVMTTQRWNGSALSTIPQMAALGIRYVASDNIRVFGASGGDIVYYSAFQNALDWTTPSNSGAVQFYTDLGGPITALKAFQSQIWVFKKNALGIIYHTGDASINYRLNSVSNDIGCVSHKTVVDVGEYLMWLGETDVYLGINGAAAPVGRPLRDYLDRINATAAFTSFAFTDNECYYVFFPIDDAVTPNIGFVYDIRFQKWLPYDATNVNNLIVGTKFKQSGYAANLTGTAYKMNDGTTDAGTPITWSVDSKVFDDGTKEAEKELYEMYIQGKFPVGSTFTVQVSPDDIGTTWYTVAYDPTDMQAATQNKKVIVPLNVVPPCNFYRYRISGTGPVTIEEVQRYAMICPVQY